MPLVIGPLICERNQWCLVEMHIGIWEVLCFGSYKLTTSGQDYFQQESAEVVETCLGFQISRKGKRLILKM